MIRKKLKLENVQALDDLEEVHFLIIQKIMPPLVKNENEEDQLTKKDELKKEKDQLKEIYAAARNYCSVQSDRTAQVVSYHWGLLRLARATLLPLLLLGIVLSIRLFISGLLLIELFLLAVTVAAAADVDARQCPSRSTAQIISVGNRAQSPVLPLIF